MKEQLKWTFYTEESQSVGHTPSDGKIHYRITVRDNEYTLTTSIGSFIGAACGVGEGLTGQCYAFPTLDNHLQRRSMDELRRSRNLLYHTCIENPDKRFLLTKVGFGLAGYPEDDMKALFSTATFGPPDNMMLPEDWQ